jgi:hypothetical protein
VKATTHNAIKKVAGYTIALLLCVGVAFAQPASALEESITLSPPDKHYDIKAGESKSDELTVINYGDVAYDFVVYTAPYSVKDDRYTPDFTSPTDNGDAYKWVRFNQTKWRAEPKQIVKVPFTLTASPGAAAGGHYGVIFVETQPIVSDQTGVARKKRLAMVLYANVDGPTTTAGAVKSISSAWFQTTPPLRADVTVENTGKTDFNAKSKFIVKDLFNTVKYSNEKENVVLPATTRIIDHVWERPAWVGVYKLHTEVTVLGKTTVKDSFVIMAPKWLLFVLALAALVLVARALSAKKTNRPKRTRT